MDGKGLVRISEALNRVQIVGHETRVESFMSPEATHSVRFLSINAGGPRQDPSDINHLLDGSGLMFHEGQIVTAETEGPLLKYLGSNGVYHAYEDVASK